MASGPTIVAKFIADTRQLTKEVDSATSKTGSKISGFAKGAAIALGSAFAVSKVVEFGKASVEAAAADAASQTQLAAALKNTTGATEAQIAASEKFIGHLSRQTAIADDDLRPALATLVRGFKDTTKAQQALSLATDISAGTGKDLSTVSAALSKAALGNTGALGKLGIATKNADGSAKSLDQIMGDLSKTFSGQAAAAANTTAGKMQAAKVQFGEFQESVGTTVMPVVAAFASMLSTTLLPALQTVFGFISSNRAAMVAVFAAIAAAFLIWAINAGLAAAATLAAIAPLLAIAAPFIALGAVVAAVTYLIIRNWSTIVNASKVAWAAVTAAVMAAFNWVKRNWPLLLAIITGPIGLATLAIIKNWNTIKDAATALYTWVVGKFTAIGTFFSGIVSTIASAVGRIVDAIKAPINAVIGAWNSIEFRVPTIHLPEFDTHIPGIGKVGGGTVGGLTIGFPDIPKLASGAVLTAPTLFVGGEAGTELVTPEDLLRSIIRDEGGGHYTLNLYPRTADAADIAYGFRRLEIMAGVR